nr:acyl-CoA N-acyltransferase [Tanacetum cinerariifolium]
IIEDFGGCVTSDGKDVGFLYISAKDAVLRAIASLKALLKGFKVYLAAHVHPPINTLSAIVRSAGGNVICDVEKAKDLTNSLRRLAKSVFSVRSTIVGG